MSILFTYIKELVQVREHTNEPLRGTAMDELPSIKNAYLYVEDGRIVDYGSMDDLHPHPAEEVYNCENQIIAPGYVDSHTHLVFAATREKEFEDRIHGLSYEEIAARGGGILNSAAKLADMSEDELYLQAQDRLKQLIAMGTTAIEIKSGYGLSVESEIKILRVVKRLKIENYIPIKATFLGAHAIPLAFKDDRKAYLDLIVNEMLPVIGEENLADYIDVFCEKNYFTVDEMLRVIEAGSAYGLKAKVHLNQFNAIGAIDAAVKAGAVSVDHLEVMTTADYESLADSNTIATALPSCSFFLGLDYAPVNEMIEKNIAVALATDYNPGSTPSGNMNFVFSLACIKMKMTPQRAFNAMTVNAAHAMGLQDEVGSISRGKKAHLLFFKDIDSIAAVPYHFGHSIIDRVLVNGHHIQD
ncbi:imidazolonepropionase [Nonlabens ulvanivorans]|uniref:Imidazolonepropionase n=1 Tax=Nonlabens ulvanivorans TaxID=906888 RepID=A0A084JVD8_NONUL|nr:imidazolonepropionase [Nonlabens ulvanivorans]KEZ92922.1 imidazolonepropionase [Nonlabens ulvanivorans]PRX12849.1 imidazolonepropionase [Nonlabens ulvanivorans]